MYVRVIKKFYYVVPEDFQKLSILQELLSHFTDIYVLNCYFL